MSTDRRDSGVARQDADPPAATSEKPIAAATQPAPAHRATRALWALNIVLAYALSPLPLGIALDLMPFSVATAVHEVLQPAYAPLVWLSQKSDRVRHFYEWYESLADA